MSDETIHTLERKRDELLNEIEFLTMSGQSSERQSSALDRIVMLLETHYSRRRRLGAMSSSDLAEPSLLRTTADDPP